MERQDTYPYPLRPSEFVKNEECIFGTQELQLSETERTELLAYESALYDKLETAKKGQSGDHTVYFEAFSNPVGKRLFVLAYLDPRVHTDTAEVTDEDNPDTDKTDWDKEFARIYEIASDTDAFASYIQEFPELEAAAQMDIEAIFNEVKLEDVTKGLRKRMNEYSASFAREQFRNVFFNANGELGRVENPQRIVRPVHAESGKAREARLRGLKRELKGEETTEAQGKVIQLYLRAINVLLAHDYDYPTLERTTNPTRSLEKVDHYLHGVGKTIDTDGLFQSLPEGIRKFIERSVREPETSEVYERYNAVEVNAQDYQKIAQLTLAHYGWDNWKVVFKKTGSTSVSYKRINKTGEVRIVENSTRGLVGAMSTIAHEVEGHVLRIENQRKSSGSSLKITENVSISRSDVLSEAAAMDIESKTKREIAGISRMPEPYHYLAAASRELGADFKTVFKACLEVRAHKEYGLYLEDLLKDREKYDKVFDYVYPRTLRVFRRNTPLSDTSGHLTTSAELDYTEQYLIGAASDKTKKLMYQAGIDLYSINELTALGLLDVDSIREPDMYCARVLWPQIKAYIDNGKTVSEALSLIEAGHKNPPTPVEGL